MIDSKKKYLHLSLLIIIFFTLYLFTNNFFIGSPTIINETVFDKWTIFSPNWIWIYLLAYPLLPFTFLITNKEKDLTFFSNSFLILTILSCIVFFIFPTFISREQYKVTNQGFFTELAFDILRKLDKPHNCLPSLHVGIAFLCSWNFYKKHTFKFTCMLVLAILISYSTMAVKQHLFWDVLSGFTLSLVVYNITKIRFSEDLFLKLLK